MSSREKGWAWQAVCSPYHAGMIRNLLFPFFALLAMPLMAQEEIPIEQRVRETAATAIAERMSDPNNPGQAQISRLEKTENGFLLCATSDAYNASGTYIGRDYWEVIVNEEGDTVTQMRNATGLLSPCYGAEFAPYEELLDR